MPDISPRAVGPDRVERGEGGEIFLSCPSAKSWTPRKPRTLTTAEHPGTAIEWEDRLFEVIRAEPLPGGRVRYQLAPWAEAHAIRRLERYDATGERARAEERRARERDSASRTASILLAPVLGLLPGAIQKRMERDFGAPAVAMTVASALPLFAIGFLGCFAHLAGGFGAAAFLPVWLAPPAGVAAYLFIESSLRLASAIAGGEPMGSLPVVLIAGAWRIARRPAAIAAPRPPEDAERTASDRFTVLEPLLSLLSPAEQEALARRFPFDPIRQGKITAALLLAIAGLNALISLAGLAADARSGTDVMWLLPSLYVLAEQVSRWRRLNRGEPAGSVFAFLVRPLARPLLTG